MIWLFLLAACFGPSRPEPIVDAQLATVAFPLEKIYISETSWTHIFKVDAVCLADTMSTKDLQKVHQLVQDTGDAYNRYMMVCNDGSMLPATQHNYICTLLKSELSLMNSTLIRFKEALKRSNNVESNYAFGTEESPCYAVDYPSLTEIPLYDDFEWVTRPKRSVGPKVSPVKLIDDTNIRNPNSVQTQVKTNVPTSHSDPPQIGVTLTGPGSHNSSNLPSVTNYYVTNNTNVFLSGSHDRQSSQHSSGLQQAPSMSQSAVQGITTLKKPTLSDRYISEMVNRKWSDRGITDLIQQAKSACYRDPFSASTHVLLKSYQSAIDTYLQMTNEDICSHLPSSTLCDEGNKQDRSRQRRSVDESSGWLPWDFSISKWMWGGLNHKDGEEINSMFESVQKDINLTNTRFLEIANNTVSAMSTMRTELIEYSNNIEKKLTSLSTTADNWSNQINEVVERINDNVTITSILAMGSLLLAQSSQVRDFISELTEYTDTHSRDLYTILAAVTEKKVPLEHISLTDRSQVINHINAQLNNNLQTIPGSGVHDIFQDLTPVCRASGKSLYFYYTIPLITKPYDFQAWQLSSIPIDTAAIDVQVTLEANVLMISDTLDTWYKLNDALYASCISNKARVCPFSPPMFSKKDPNCMASIVLASPMTPDVCKIESSPFTRIDVPAILPIDGQRWLISSKLDGANGVIRCRSNTTGMNEDTQTLLRGVQLITLPKECALRTESITLVSYDTDTYKSLSESSSERNSLPKDVVTPNLKSFKTLWSTSVNRTRMVIKALTENVSMPMLEMSLSGSSISNLSKLIQGTSKDLNNSLLALNVHHGSQNHDHTLSVKLPGNLPLIMLPFSITTAVIVQVVFDIVVVTMFCWRRIHGLMTPYGMPGYRRNPQYGLDTFVSAAPAWPSNRIRSFNPFEDPGHPLTPTSSTTTTTTTEDPIKKRFESNDSISKIEAKLEYLYHLTRVNHDYLVNSTYYHPALSALSLPTEKENLKHFFWMVSIMLSVAFICHQMLLRAFRRTMVRYLLRTSGVILNESTLHHGPETKLMISFIVKVYRSWFKKVDEDGADVPHSIQLVMIQVGTLPHPRKSYVINKRSTTEPFMEPQTFSRFASKIHVNLRWGRFCLKLSNNSSAELCESLPSTVVVPADDIITTFGKHLPWGWSHICVEGVTHIALQDATGTSMGYDANTDDTLGGGSKVTLQGGNTVKFI